MLVFFKAGAGPAIAGIDELAEHVVHASGLLFLWPHIERDGKLWGMENWKVGPSNFSPSKLLPPCGALFHKHPKTDVAGVAAGIDVAPVAEVVAEANRQADIGFISPTPEAAV